MGYLELDLKQTTDSDPNSTMLRSNLIALLLLLLAGCATTPGPITAPEPISPQRIGELGRSIAELDESIDPEEAGRAALVALEYSNLLARQYDVTTSPLMHNLLVNMGIKSRGLCIHWTEDLLARLREENFHSLDLHWAIANHDVAFRIEHSTVVISAAGDSLYRGIVLDPWRDAGRLYWAYTLQDEDYNWQPQAEVHAFKLDLQNSVEPGRPGR